MCEGDKSGDVLGIKSNHTQLQLHGESVALCGDKQQTSTANTVVRGQVKIIVAVVTTHTRVIRRHIHKSVHTYTQLFMCETWKHAAAYTTTRTDAYTQIQTTVCIRAGTDMTL